MRRLLRKCARVRLEAKSYRELHHQVLRRDGWRCQFCGHTENLQVHHIQFRSRAGNDVEENLITLCYGCHQALHLHLFSKGTAKR